MLARALLGVLLLASTQGALAQGNAPTVSVAITAPAQGAVLGGPATVTLSAAASINRANWAILRVEFYSGANLVGTAGVAPYSFSWTNVAPGTYTLTAKAIAANPGQAKQNPATHPNMPTLESVSAPVTIRVDAPPVVSLTAPANNALYAGPATIALAASATDSVGTITKVDFYQGATLIGTASAAPYSFTWTNVAPGVYILTAVAINDAGQSTASSALSVRVDSPPSVSLTSPANGASFAAPANIPIAATVSDTVGTVTKVAFYQGATLIAMRDAPPYSFSWTGVRAGTYSLSAVATNDAGQSTISAAIAITVRQAAAQLYFIEVDHLNTPRLTTDANQQVVWRWDQGEPFGDSPPDENPSGLGVFTQPLRFGGWQYADDETGEFWNWMRTYSKITGRFPQSDPIGLGGGLNTYLYGSGDPLRFVDPRGENAGVIVVEGLVLIGGTILMSPPGRKAAKSIAQKIAEMCTPSSKDPCDEQQKQEEEDCWNNFGDVFGAGHFSYRGCMDRARIRGDLCRRGLPMPPPWGDPDVTGQPRPPKPPRLK